MLYFVPAPWGFYVGCEGYDPTVLCDVVMGGLVNNQIKYRMIITVTPGVVLPGCSSVPKNVSRVI